MILLKYFISNFFYIRLKGELEGLLRWRSSAENLEEERLITLRIHDPYR
jgi:hypothetical protein